MITWLTELEFRQSGARATGVTINVAFLQEIKEDNIQFRDVLTKTSVELSADDSADPQTAVEVLAGLRDELENHFALEEFFGYFDNAKIANPSIGVQAQAIRNEHQTLYLQLNEIIEKAEQVLYRECSPPLQMRDVIREYDQFQMALEEHERSEMDLMMRLCNEELGVGG